MHEPLPTPPLDRGRSRERKCRMWHESREQGGDALTHLLRVGLSECPLEQFTELVATRFRSDRYLSTCTCDASVFALAGQRLGPAYPCSHDRRRSHRSRAERPGSSEPPGRRRMERRGPGGRSRSREAGSAAPSSRSPGSSTTCSALSIRSPRPSPIIRGFGLENYGLTWRRAPTVLAHPRPDGSCLALHTDLGKTARLVGLVPRRGRRSWERLFGQWQRIGGELIDALFTPFPPVMPVARLAAKLGPEGHDPFRALLNASAETPGRGGVRRSRCRSALGRQRAPFRSVAGVGAQRFLRMAAHVSGSTGGLSGARRRRRQADRSSRPPARGSRRRGPLQPARIER